MAVTFYFPIFSISGQYWPIYTVDFWRAGKSRLIGFQDLPNLLGLLCFANNIYTLVLRFLVRFQAKQSKNRNPRTFLLGAANSLHFVCKCMTPCCVNNISADYAKCQCLYHFIYYSRTRLLFTLYWQEIKIWLVQNEESLNLKKLMPSATIPSKYPTIYTIFDQPSFRWSGNYHSHFFPQPDS